jgi:hypothetical protein
MKIFDITPILRILTVYLRASDPNWAQTDITWRDGCVLVSRLEDFPHLQELLDHSFHQ